MSINCVEKDAETTRLSLKHSHTKMRAITRTGFLMLVILFALGLAIAGYAQTEKTKPAPFGKIDSTVSFVEVGGYWEQGSSSGRYRVAVQTRCSPEHCYDRLYVQWLEIKRSETKVISTQYIKETGDLMNFKRVQLVPVKAGTSVEVESEATGGEIKSRSCLRLRTPGEYSHTEGPCGK
jgi:hypothetical protein